MFSDKDLRKLIVPLVIEQILAVLVGTADTVMVSYAGESAISGVSLVDMFAYMVITILTALATGGAVIVSQYLGNKEQENANRAAGQLMVGTLLASGVVCVICAALNSQILHLLYGSAEESVLQAAETYMFITAFSFPFLGIYNSSAALFRSMKKTNMTMYVSLLMNVINIAGNAIGIFVLKAGVAGVAVPTLLSRAVAGIVMTALAFNTKHEVYLKAKNVFCRNFEMLRRILKIAIPNAIENGLFALGRVLVTSIVAMFGTAQIAANGVAGSVDLIAIIVVSAMNLAVVTVVGQCVGANRYDEAEHYLKKMMKVSWIATAVLTVLVWLCLPMILSCFAVSEETYHYAYILVMLHNIFATVLHPTSFNLPNGLRAAGDAKFTMYIGIGSMAMFRIGSAVLFGILLNMGVVGVWIAMGMDWLARSVAFVWRFKSKKWQKFRAI